MPPEMPPMPPMPEGGAMPPMPPMPPADAGAGRDPAAVIDEILATGAASGTEIVSALVEQGFDIMPTMDAGPVPEEMPLEEPPPEEPVDDLLAAAKFGMEEDEKKKAGGSPF